MGPNRFAALALLLTLYSCPFGQTGAAGQLEQLLIADNGEALVTIVRGADPTRPEQVAAEELTSYLSKVTGAAFQTVDEGGVAAGQPAIYIGWTASAKSRGIDAERLGEEESILRSVPGGLILTGGRPRGTLYAVYTFLEDLLGCRWYTPDCERVPHRPVCSIPAIDRRVEPAFSYRDTYTHCHDKRMFPDVDLWKWHVIRNRFNGRAVGGWIWGKYVKWSWCKSCLAVVPREDSEIGPGWSVMGGPHSFFRLVPADRYFKTHPEYFSERKGRRVPTNGLDGNHLCLTNKALRGVVTANLKSAMREFPGLRAFSVCMNDGGCRGACNCARCEAFAKKHSWTDLHVDFINEIADGIKDEFPQNYVYTLAYSYASDPPKTFKYRDNVILQACLLTSNRVRVPRQTDKKLAQLREWRKSAPTMWVWDYVQPSGMPVTFLQPVYDRMQAGYRLAKQLGVRGVFAENELMAFGLPMAPEFYGMRLWVMSRLMQDPDRDLDALIVDFMSGYYGSAGKALEQYIALQRQGLHLWPMRMVDLAYMRNAQTLFDRAEGATQGEPEHLTRVKTARIWLDIAALFFRSKLHGEFLLGGGRLEDYPYETNAIKARVLDALTNAKDVFWRSRYRYPRRTGREYREIVEHTREYVELLCRANDYCPLPEQFRGLPSDRVLDVPGYQVGHGKRYRVVDDPGSVFGLALCGEHADEMPVHMGVYDLVSRRGLVGRLLNDRDVGVAVDAAAVAGTGYHLYELGRTAITTNCYAWITKSWQIQHHLEMLHDAADMDQQWDIYVSIKLTGPSYPHGDPDEKDAIYFDRMVLVRAQE